MEKGIRQAAIGSSTRKQRGRARNASAAFEQGEGEQGISNLALGLLLVGLQFLPQSRADPTNSPQRHLTVTGGQHLDVFCSVARQQRRRALEFSPKTQEALPARVSQDLNHEAGPSKNQRQWPSSQLYERPRARPPLTTHAAFARRPDAEDHWPGARSRSRLRAV